MQMLLVLLWLFNIHGVRLKGRVYQTLYIGFWLFLLGRVLDCLDELNLEIPMRDIRSEEGARDDLLEIGGKGQVPCLVIDGKPLYESADIISWLKANVQ